MLRILTSKLTFGLITNLICALFLVFNHHATFSLPEYAQQQQQQHQEKAPLLFDSPTMSELPPLLLPSEWLDDVQVDVPAPCAAFKCLYNSRRGKRLGYLVAQFRKNDVQSSGHKDFRTLQKGYELAERLRTTHNIRHLLLAPPSKVDCTAKVCVEDLNRLTYMARGREGENDVLGRQSFTAIHPGKPWTKLLVQPVELASQPSIQFGLSVAKYSVAIEDMKVYASSLVQQDMDVGVFERNVRRGIEQALGVIQAEPCLLTDFQILLDRYGHVYHLDFDRCFENNPKKQLGLKEDKFARGQRMIMEFVEALIAKVNELQSDLASVVTTR